MKALVHNGIVKFLLENSDTIDPSGSGIIIRTATGQPDLVVNDISFSEVEEVLNAPTDLREGFFGGKYNYAAGNFTLAEGA